MSSLWIAVAVLAVPPADVMTPIEVPAVAMPAEQQPLIARRTGRELEKAAHAALARWAPFPGNTTPEKHVGLAAGEFIVLYRELKADDKLARSQRQPLMTKIRGRLLALQRRVQKHIAIEKRLAKQQKRPRSVEAAAAEHDVLAQRGGFGGGMGGRGFGGGMMPGGGFGGAAQDNGEQLVDLIQQTIAPASWDINGGAGSIYYWRPGQALVIRNRGEVHERIGGLLQQMNRLGR